MKKAILFITMSLVFNILCAQTTTEPVYLILTSKTTEGDGIVKSIGKIDSLHKTSPIFYHVSTKSKQIYLMFMHFNYNVSQLTKIRKVKANDQQETLTKSTSFLKTITPIDLDILFPKWTKEQSLAFRDSLQGKKIYIIDRSEIKDNQIELLEVTCIKSAF